MQRIIGYILAIATISLFFAEVIQSQDLRYDEEKKFFRQNAHSVNIHNKTDFSDLRVLDKAFKNKRIVLLGEFTHGSKEINLLKNRIIAYLHQKHGFKVLLLESGIGEIYSANFLRDSLTNRSMLNGGLVGPWRTFEYLELMNYLKENQTLKVGGFDVQRTGRSFAGVLGKLFELVNKNNDLSSDVETRNLEITSKLENRKTPVDTALIQEKQKLTVDYQKIIKAINENQDSLQTRGWDLEKLKIIRRTLENRIEYLNYYQQFRTDNDFRKRFSARDSMMAENVLWFANQVYNKEKIIISAHNYHIAKHNDKELVMGEILAEKFGNNAFSIGIFGGKGEIADNAGKTESMASPTVESDIQTVINRINNDAVFLEIPKKPKTGTNWLFENITINNSFVNLDSDNKMILQKSFDGLILIQKVSPPVFNTNLEK